jgi:transglutaminase-like putative cysteine protease
MSAERAFRAGRRGATSELGEDAPYLVEPRVFLARAKAKPMPAEGVFERQLHWRRVVRMLADQRVSQTIHYAREIGVEPRNEEELYERVPEAGPMSKLLVARVHRPGGSVLEPEQQEPSGAMVRWPKLRRGDVVEVAIRSYTPGPVGRRGDAPFYLVDYVGSVTTRPVLYNEVVIDAPAGSPLAFDVVGGRPDRRVERRAGDRTITELVWDSPPTIADEPLAPPPSESLPLVVGSIYPTWREFLDWYQGAVAGFTVPDEQIRQVARELTLGKKTRDEKLEALFNYVADDIRYVNYQSGEWWLPNRPQHLLARRQGDCDDKANLLISLLAAEGIEATEVLIQTRFTGQPRILFESKIAVPMFDHGIVYLPDAQGGRFLDPTSPQSRLGSLPSMDARAAVVLVGSGTPRAIATPSSSPDDHGVEASWSVELDAEGGAHVRAVERHVGDAAFLLRTNLGQVDARAQWVEANLLTRSLPGARLEGEVGFDGALPGGAAKLDYRASVRRLARREGDEFVLRLAPATQLAMQLAPLAERTLPVVLPPRVAPAHHDVTIEVALPKGWSAKTLPPDDALGAGGFGAATQTFARGKKPGTLRITRSLRFDASRIEPQDYPRWRAWLRDVDRMMRRGVRLAALTRP